MNNEKTDPIQFANENCDIMDLVENQPSREDLLWKIELLKQKVKEQQRELEERDQIIKRLQDRTTPFSEQVKAKEAWQKNTASVCEQAVTDAARSQVERLQVGSAVSRTSIHQSQVTTLESAIFEKNMALQVAESRIKTLEAEIVHLQSLLRGQGQNTATTQRQMKEIIDENELAEQFYKAMCAANHNFAPLSQSSITESSSASELSYNDPIEGIMLLVSNDKVTPAEALSHPFITMSSRTETLSTSTQGTEETPENANEESESATKQSSQMCSPENSVRFTEEGVETQNTVKPRGVSTNDTSSISELSCYDSVEDMMSLVCNYEVEDGNDPADMYDLLEFMGEGCFGKVLKCLNKETREIVAVKAIKMRQNVDFVVAKELYILGKVSALDPDADNIIRFNKYFQSADGHHCMEFELLDLSVDNLMKRRRAPFSLNEIRPMAKDLLISLKGLQTVGVMHTDIKPDNIMYMDQQNNPFRVKLIDFGVAIPKERAQVGTIMQPSGYRAPEVTLGLPLTEAVDMWSLGCCLLQWYLSTLPFPCLSPYHHLQMITHLMGVPDGELIKKGMYGNDYFVQDGSEWRLKGVSEYVQTTGKTPTMDWYPLEVFKDLEDVIQNCRQNRPGPDIEYRTFLDLLQKMFHLDPDKRITPAEALSHPFITMSSRTETLSTSTQGAEETPENANEESESATKQSSQMCSPENSVRFTEEGVETQNTVKPRGLTINDTSSISELSCYDSVEYMMSLVCNYEVEDGNDPADMYDLLELMGEGCFGKVLKCLNKETREIVAVKAIKMRQNVDFVVAKELYILGKVSALDPDADNIIRFNKYFQSADGHHCMEFELLDLSVDNLMKRRRAPFSLNEIRPMAKDLLISLKGLQTVGVMHTDIKPDNIMYMDQQNNPFRVKLIDFGVAIPKERAQVGTIMQPSGYRAPEVTLGLPLTEAVDMWSLGCCLLQWYLSTLPFPCLSPYHHLQMITHLMGVPDGELIKKGMYGNDYFVQDGSEWRLKGVSEYVQTTGKTPTMDWYPLEVFKDLEDVIQNCRQNRPGPDIEYRTFLDFLQKMFHLDPDKRITPAEALSHPFITMSSRTETLSTSTQGAEETPENANEESESATKQSSQMCSPENSVRFTEEGVENQNTVKPRGVSINDTSSISELSCYDSVEYMMSLVCNYEVEDGNDPADMYDPLELMGEGCFGKVLKCLNKETRQIVAVKDIKMRQNVDYVVAKELYILGKVSALDPDADNIIRFNKYFQSADGHHYMEFELLDLSVDDLMKRRRAPFSLNEIRPMAKDLLISLKGLQTVGVMHTDIKPDNIMYMDQQNNPFRVKLIDFGVAIPKERAQVGTIMQPSGYRAPEVTLGLPLTEAVDMWSLGCCLLQWYLSTLPFPCLSPYHHLQMITHLMGVPDGELIKQAMYGNCYFVQDGSEWRLKGVSEYEQTTGKTPTMDWYPLEVFKDLEDVIQNCRQNRPGPDIEYRTFLDLLQKMFHLDPDKRITPAEALSHPFITMSSRTETLSTSTQGAEETPENANEESESATKQSSQMCSPENSVRFTEEGVETQNTVKPRGLTINDTSSISELSCYDSVEYMMSLVCNYEVEDGNDPADMYDLLELMGEGCFGKVLKCLNKETREIVAVKAIKMRQNVDFVVAKELYILGKVSALDPDADNIIRFNKYFQSADGHHCMEFELLDLSVDNLMKRRRAPFSLNEIRPMAKDLLISLKGLQTVGVMHTDIKPDNIMYMDQQNNPFRVKLIDFGVAIPKERAQVGTIMQPSGYRAPEVTLGLPLTEAVDMWSLGCCLLQWYLSTLPFPCLSPYHHLQMITHLMGVPDGELIKKGMYGNDYFVQDGSEWRLKGVSEYEQTTGKTPTMDWYPLEVFKDLEDVIQNCRQNRPGPDIEYRTFLDLLQKMFHLDPDKRITPAEALSHPFITMSSRTETLSTSTQGAEETPENANEESESATKQSSQMCSPENSVRFTEEGVENQNTVKPRGVSINDTSSISELSCYDSVEYMMSLVCNYEVEDGNDPADMYDPLELMGEGCFGKVLKCLNKETRQIVAVKDIKMRQNVDYVVAKEVYILGKVSALDPDAHNIIRFNKYFQSADGHHYMEFELLDLSVDDLMKRRRAPFSLNEIRPMAKDLLISLKGLQTVGVMHTDIKPDNIMYVDQQNNPFRVKLIDFGVAIPKERAQVGTIMQPSGYRAPEVTLGLPLTEAVDMWSLGCCLLQWYLSTLPFPCLSPYHHLQMITHLMGVPDGELIKQAMYGNCYFVQDGSEWRLKGVSEYEQTTGKTPTMDWYPLEVFKDLEDVIRNCRQNRPGPDIEYRTFLDLLQKMFHLDPDKRITPAEALSHPFITMSSRTETLSTSTQGIEKTPENANKMSESATKQSSQISSPECSVRFIEIFSETQSSGKPSRVSMTFQELLQKMRNADPDKRITPGEAPPVIAVSSRTETPSTSTQGINETPDANEESDFARSWSKRRDGQAALSIRPIEERQRPDSPVTVQPASAQHDCQVLQSPEVTTTGLNMTTISGTPDTGTGESEEGETSKSGKTANQQPSNVEVTTLLKPFLGCKVTTTAWQNPAGVRRRTTRIRLLQEPTLISGISDKHKDTTEQKYFRQTVFGC